MEHRDERLWKELQLKEKEFFIAKKNFLTECSDKMYILSRAMRQPVERSTALRLLQDLPCFEREMFLSDLIFLASWGHKDIDLVRKIIIDMNRELVLQKIDEYASEILIEGGEEEFRCLFALFRMLDKELLKGYINKALSHEAAGIREMGQEFLDLMS